MNINSKGKHPAEGSYIRFKVKWGWRDGLAVTALAVPPEDPGLLPSTFMAALNCNSSARAPYTLFLASSGARHVSDGLARYP